MASTIQLKRGSGAPTAGDLAQGEPALDLTNKRLYTEDSGGSVIEVGTNPSSLSIDGVAITATPAELNILDGVTATTAELNYLDITTLGTVEPSKVVTAASNGNVRFPDTERLTFGASNDLSIFHDGSNSYIDDSGTGNLLIRADDSITLKSYSGTGVKYIEAVNGGEVRAYHNNNLKFATKSTGVNITGTLDTDDLLVSNSVESNLVPSTDNTYDLGSSGNEWRNIYIDNIAYLDTVNTNSIYLNGTQISATAAELNFTDGVTSNIQTQLDSKVNLNTIFNTVADLVASSVSFSTGDYIPVRDGNFIYKVAGSGVTDHHLTTAGGVKLYALPDSRGFVPLRAMNVTVSDTMTAAETASDVATELQLLLTQGYDVSIDGFVKIASNIDTNGRQIVGTGKRTCGFFCSTAASGITMTEQGSELHNFTIESDYTAEILLTIGDGVQGNSSNDLTVSNLLVQDAAVRCLLVKEYSNWGAVECTFKRSGDRSGVAITDSSRATAEIRSVGYMTDCHITGATGWSLLLSYSKDGSWEENKFIFQGGRIHTGAEGLVRFVSYSEGGVQPAIFDGVLWENPGLTGNPGVAYSGIQEAIQAIGPAAEIQITNSRKATMRRATAFVSAQDGARIKVDKVPQIRFQTLGSSAQGKLATTRVAESTTYTGGIYVSDPGVLVNNGGTIYAPKPELIPFTSPSSFNSAQWEDVTTLQGIGYITIDEYPEFNSDGTVGSTAAMSEMIKVGTASKQPSLSFNNKSLVRTIIDGTSVSGISTSPGGSTLSVIPNGLTKNSSIEVDTATTTTPANISFNIDVEEDLVNRPLMISATFAYRQTGGTFGSAGNMKFSLRVRDTNSTGGVTGVGFPSDSESETTTIVETVGSGNLTDYYRSVHMFTPTQAGTFKVNLIYDDQSVSRDDHFVLDDVSLWAVKSAAAGEYLAPYTQSYEGSVLFPRDFGAAGDGTTDDTAAFTSLVTKVQEISDAGFTPIIDLDGKDYLIKGSLKFRRKIVMHCNGAILRADGTGTISSDFDQILDGDGSGSGKYCFIDVEGMAESSFVGNLRVIGKGTTNLLGGVSTYPSNLVAFARINGNTTGESFNAHFDSLDIITFDRGFYTPAQGSGSGIYPFTRSYFGRLDFESVNMAFDFNSANAWDETFVGVLRIARQQEASNLFNADLNAGNIFLNGNKQQHEVSGTAITLATTSGSTSATCNVSAAFSVGDEIAIEDAESYGDYLITKVSAVSGTTVTLEDQAGATATGAVYYTSGGLDIDQGKLITNKLYIEGPHYKCIYGSRLTSISAEELKYSSGSLGAYKGHPIVVEHQYSHVNIGRVSRKENGIGASGKKILSYLYYGLVRISGANPEHYGRISIIENKAQIASDGITPLQTGVGIFDTSSTTATNGKTNLVVGYTDQNENVDPFNNLTGTFTPVVADASAGGNTATGSFEGYYSVNGNLVTVSMRLVDINTTGMTGANALFVRNLPYPAADAPTALFPFTGSIGQMNKVTFTNVPVPTIKDNQNYIQFYEASSGASAGNLTVADIDSGLSDIYFSISYLIDL